MTIYVVVDGSCNYKIGVTKNITQRLRSLRTGNASKLRVAFTFDGDRSTEKAIHEALKLYRKNGEWFSYKESDSTKYDFRFGHFIMYMQMDGAKVLTFDTSELANFSFDPKLAANGVPVLNFRDV